MRVIVAALGLAFIGLAYGALALRAGADLTLTWAHPRARVTCPVWICPERYLWRL